MVKKSKEDGGGKISRKVKGLESLQRVVVPAAAFFEKENGYKMKIPEKYRCWSYGTHCCYFLGIKDNPCGRREPLYTKKCDICGNFHCGVHLSQYTKPAKRNQFED